MASMQRANVLRQVAVLLSEGVVSALPDDRLLERFATRRDEAAFEALVERHGPMVLRVCRQLLRDGHYAEDAFQATFLVLARKVGTVRRYASVAPWLYRVACRVARKAQAATDRVREQERDVASAVAACSDSGPASEMERRERFATLHEEITRLPDVYRELVVLCYLEGLTCEQAARHLGRPLGTVTVQLGRARERLRSRLVGRGLAGSAAGLIAAGRIGNAGETAVPMFVPRALITSTTCAACGLVKRGPIAAATVLSQTASLTKGVFNAMFGTKIKAVLGLAAILIAAWTVAPTSPSGHAEQATDRVPKRLGETWTRPAVLSLAYSPDGRALAAGAYDGTIRVCDPNAAKETMRFKAHSGAVQALSYAPDGKSLASAGRNGTIVLWDTATGKELRRLAGPGPAVLALSFSPDGKFLASGGLDGRVHVWDPATGKEAKRLNGHKGGIHAIGYAPDGQTVASGGEDGTVRLWDPVDGKELRSIRMETPIRAIAFAPDGQTLAAAGVDGSARIWNTSTGEQIRQISNLQGVVHCLTYSPDGKILAAVDYSSIRFFNPDDGSDLPGVAYVGYTGYVANVQALRFSPDGLTVAHGSGDGAIHLRDVGANEDRTTIDPPERDRMPEVGHKDYVESLAFSPDGKILASGSYDRTIKVWERSTGKELRTIEGHGVGYIGHEGTIRSLAFSPDGKRLASASEDQSVRVWDPGTGAETLKIEGDTGYVGSVSFSPDGKLLASACDDGKVRVFDAESGQETHSIDAHVGWAVSVAFAPDGKTLVSSGADKKVKIWDVTNGSRVKEMEGHTSFPDCVAIARDGKTIASGSWDGTVRIWDPATGQELHVLSGHEERVHSIAFSPDAKLLASGGEDGTARLWDVASGKSIAVVANPVSWVFPVAFSPDGKTLAAGSGSAVLLLEVGELTRP
jgi:RNA polymerase sigma factor (sigma-70 family)